MGIPIRLCCGSVNVLSRGNKMNYWYDRLTKLQQDNLWVAWAMGIVVVGRKG